jgi:hypothetical protein
LGRNVGKYGIGKRKKKKRRIIEKKRRKGIKKTRVIEK